MYELARGYREDAMSAYVELQEREFELEPSGYTATRHQREVGAGYFDQVMQVVVGRAVVDAGPARARPKRSSSRRRGVQHEHDRGEAFEAELVGALEGADDPDRVDRHVGRAGGVHVPRVLRT